MTRVAAGRDFQGRVMSNSGAAGAGTGIMRPADYIAVTENATAPSDASTALTGELTGGGFIRALATFAMGAGAFSYTLTKTFTSSDATARTINKIGIFNAATVGTLVFETAVPSPPTLVSGDQLTITSTISI